MSSTRFARSRSAPRLSGRPVHRHRGRPFRSIIRRLPLACPASSRMGDVVELVFRSSLSCTVAALCAKITRDAATFVRGLALLCVGRTPAKIAQLSV